jgi:hypothetical protein
LGCRCLLFSLLVALGACEPQPGAEGPHSADVEAEPVAYEAVQAVFDVHCVLCHGANPVLQGDLDLRAGSSYAMLVQGTTWCDLDGRADVPLVSPGDLERSALSIKIHDDVADGLTCGREMPATGTPLATTHPEAAALIDDWILSGAQR